jgi:hypothetical protein
MIWWSCFDGAAFGGIVYRVCGLARCCSTRRTLRAGLSSGVFVENGLRDRAPHGARFRRSAPRSRSARALEGRELGIHAKAPDGVGHGGREDRVVVEDQGSMRGLLGEGVAQLLDHPARRLALSVFILMSREVALMLDRGFPVPNSWKNRPTGSKTGSMGLLGPLMSPRIREISLYFP